MIRMWEKNDDGDWESIELLGHTGEVTSVNWSPDGQSFISGSYDFTIRLWEKNDDGVWESIELRGHRTPVKSVNWNPDGKSIISGSRDSTFRWFK